MTTFQYHYDPLDRLIQTAGVQRFYNQSRMTTELEGTQSHSVFQQDGQLLAQRRRDRTKDECSLLGTDLQQSVLHVVGADKRHVIAYNPYGHRPVENGLIRLLGFNGERADPVTGHYLLGNGYRAFNPVLMRFNSPDSMSPFGNGGVNSYAYCKGNPVLRTDPTGHFPIALVIDIARSFGRGLQRVGRLVDHVVEKYLIVGPRIVQGSGAAIIGMGLITSGRDSYTALSTGTALIVTGGALEYGLARVTRGLGGLGGLGELDDALAHSLRVARENYDDLTRAYETIDAQQMQITQLQARGTGAPPPYTATSYPPGPPPPYTPDTATRIRRPSI